MVSIFLTVLGLVLVGRLVQLQIIQHDRLAAQSDKQYLRTVEIASGRGNIYDRNRNQLATNIRVESVYADPKSVTDKNNTARILATALKLNPKEVLRKLKSKKHFVWIKRKGGMNAVEKLKQLDLAGVGFIAEAKRYYPKRKLAASTLGFVGLDNQGLAGVEHFHHAVLKGNPQTIGTGEGCARTLFVDHRLRAGDQQGKTRRGVDPGRSHSVYRRAGA